MSDQTQQIGYDSYNILLNLGTLSLIIILYCLKLVIVFVIMLPLSYCIPKIKEQYKIEKNNLFFDDFFGIIFEGYFNIIICCLFNFFADSESQDNNLTNKVLAHVLLVIMIFCVPAILIHLYQKSREQLDEPNYRKRWGKAYQNIRLNSKYNMLYNLVFCVRSLIFIGLLF